MEAGLLETEPSDNDGGCEAQKKKLSTRLWEETKLISRISLPSMVYRVMTTGVLIVTQSFIGHISSVDLAAYAIVQSISLRFINGILLGMSSATETLCGQAFGAMQYHMMGIYLQRSWLVNLVTASIMLPLMIFATPIYELLGEEEDISIATETISLWFTPFLYALAFRMTIQMFLQAQIKNITIMYLSLGAFAIHVFISWLFVCKLNYGVGGAMGALNISQWGLVLSQFVYILGGWCKETWNGFSKLAFADLAPVIKLSISSGFMLCLELWYSSILILIAGYSDNAVVDISAFSICLNLNAWEFMVAIGLMTGTCVRISNELGRGNIEAAKFSIKILMCMSSALGIFAFLIVVIFGQSFPYLFTNNDEIAEAASKLSVLLGLTMFVSSFQAVLSGVAIGCGSQAKVAIVNVVSYYVIGIPVGCVLAFVFNLGVKGIWIGMLIGMVMQVLVLVIVTWRINWDEELNKTKRRLGKFLQESLEESDRNLDNN